MGNLVINYLSRILIINDPTASKRICFLFVQFVLFRLNKIKILWYIIVTVNYFSVLMYSS